MKKPRSCHALLLVVAASLLLSALWPLSHPTHRVTAQVPTPTIELAYDDGIPWKTISNSVGGCDVCYTYQGVRFDLGGVAMAGLTAIRFYNKGQGGKLEVFITDATREHLLVDAFTVTVSSAQWNTVMVPETLLTGDFWVWVKKDGAEMPMHDAGTGLTPAGQHSFYTEHYKPGVFPLIRLERGDLMIRAVIRAEIHVGEGQDYATIQEAVDDAGEGLTIIVHDGTYNENVVVNKKLFIMSSDGPSNTVVRSQNPSAAAFDVTANGVTISGFSIQGASSAGAAAVYLDGASECMLVDNIITDNHYGMLISAMAIGNTILENDVRSNVYGIWADGSKTNIAGNRIDGNTAPLGSGVYLSATAADSDLHFNTFGSAPGMEQVPQVFCDSATYLANAINNWWGNKTGAYHASSNPNGTGAPVGEGVRFSPWLEAEPAAVKTAITTPGSAAVNARIEASTSVVKTGIGEPTVWVARYDVNPAGGFPESGTAIGKWIDVYFNRTTNLENVEVRVYYTQGEIAAVDQSSLRLYWWDGMEWRVCSESGVNTEEGFVWAVLSPGSSPGLANLGGTPFAVATTASGFAWWLILVGIAIVIVLAIVGWFVLRILPRRGYDDYE